MNFLIPDKKPVMNEHKAIEMIDGYLAEDIAMPEWVECLTFCRAVLKERLKGKTISRLTVEVQPKIVGEWVNPRYNMDKGRFERQCSVCGVWVSGKAKSSCPRCCVTMKQRTRSI